MGALLHSFRHWLQYFQQYFHWLTRTLESIYLSCLPKYFLVKEKRAFSPSTRKQNPQVSNRNLLVCKAFLTREYCYALREFLLIAPISFTDIIFIIALLYSIFFSFFLGHILDLKRAMEDENMMVQELVYQW